MQKTTVHPMINDENNSPLRRFLAESIGQERLCQASLLDDNARVQSTQRHRRAKGHDSVLPSTPNTTPRHNKSSCRLQTFPSFTQDYPFSRWESCSKKTTDCLSPPQRRPRRLSFLGLDSSPIILSSPDDTIKDAAHDQCRSPTYPVRRASFKCMPSHPSLDDSETTSSSPTSVRIGLEELLLKALQCEDLDGDKACTQFDEMCFEDSLSSAGI